MKYRDIGGWNEDTKIAHIGLSAMERPGRKVGLIVEDANGTPERYIAKLKERYPSLEILFSGPGPIAGCHTITITRPL